MIDRVEVTAIPSYFCGTCGSALSKLKVSDVNSMFMGPWMCLTTECPMGNKPILIEPLKLTARIME